jgi:hypothetical protein
MVTVGTPVLAVAQDSGARAWQQRLQVDIPIVVPMVEIDAANPFASRVDVAPRLLSAQPPRKLDIAGVASVAAYVDAGGDCKGAVPLELPYPGLAAPLIAEVVGARFDPARVGTSDKPAWAIIEVTFETKVRESVVKDQLLETPDPESPPQPTVVATMAPPGNLSGLPFVPVSDLSSPPLPRRIRVKLPSRELTIPVRALVHVTASGRTDRFVPLDLESGLEPWLSAFLSTWRLEPAQIEGAPTDSWVVYSCRVVLDLGNIESTSFRVVRDRGYDPAD